jgi:uncharacterized protein (TIGR02266 family)
MADTRKDRRAPLSLKVRFKSATIDEFIEQYSTDISRGGTFIKSKKPMPIGTLLKFEFQLKDESRLIHGVGRVVWKRDPEDADDDNPAGMGIKFIKMDPDSRELVQTVVQHRGDTPGKYEAGGSPEGEGNAEAGSSESQPAAASPSFFPEGGQPDQPPPEDRTAVRHASEFLASALANADDDAAAEAEAGAEAARKRTQEIERERAQRTSQRPTGSPPAGDEAADKDETESAESSDREAGEGAADSGSDKPAAAAAVGDELEEPFRSATSDTRDESAQPGPSPQAERSSTPSEPQNEGASPFADTMVASGTEQPAGDASPSEAAADRSPSGSGEEPSAAAASAEPAAASAGSSERAASSPGSGRSGSRAAAGPRAEAPRTAAEQPEEPRSKVVPILFALVAVGAVGYFAYQQSAGSGDSGRGVAEESSIGPMDQSPTSGSGSSTGSRAPEPMATGGSDDAGANLGASDSGAMAEPVAKKVTVPVESEPEGATVRIAGQPRGQTPTEVELPVGQAKTVALSKDGFLAVEKEVTASEGMAALNFTLERLPYVLEVKSEPSGAHVRVEDHRGTAPSEFRLGDRLRRPVRVMAAKGGYKRAMKRVSPDAFEAQPDAMRHSVTLQLERRSRKRPSAEESEQTSSSDEPTSSSEQEPTEPDSTQEDRTESEPTQPEQDSSGESTGGGGSTSQDGQDGSGGTSSDPSGEGRGDSTQSGTDKKTEEGSSGGSSDDPDGQGGSSDGQGGSDEDLPDNPF